VKENRKILFLSCLCLLALSTTLIFCKSKQTTPIFPVDCGHRVAGVYMSSDYCASTGQTAYSTTIIARDTFNITFNNLSGVIVAAILNCNDNTITIPTQTFPGNFSISGTGTYNANRIILNWSGLSYGVPFNCNSTLTR
jgi:hypothetical protein